MSYLSHVDPAVLYFIGAGAYGLSAFLTMRNWHKAMCGCYALIAILYCLFGLSQLAH